MQQLTRKLLHKNRKKSKFRVPPLSFFIYLPNRKSYAITVFSNRRNKKFRTKPIYQLIFRTPGDDFRKIKPSKIICCSGGRLVKMKNKPFSWIFLMGRWLLGVQKDVLMKTVGTSWKRLRNKVWDSKEVNGTTHFIYLIFVIQSCL
jgi:hypothetical protein